MYQAREGPNAHALRGKNLATFNASAEDAGTHLGARRNHPKLKRLCMAKRATKCTSSPSSIKRKRCSTFLEDNGFAHVHGPWTLGENCILDCVESFLTTTCILPNVDNLAHLYNFVVNSSVAATTNVQAQGKRKAQVNGRIIYAQKREETLKQMFYGVALLTS